ncbi:MAG: DNA-processing protein DprA [Bacillota bacterium]
MQESFNGFETEKTAEERIYLVGLSQIPGLRLKTVELLLKYFKNFKALWGATRKDLEQLTDLPAHFMDNFFKIKNSEDPFAIVGKLRRKNVQVLTLLDSSYPGSLRQIYDPPLVLYYQGNWSQKDEHMLGIVGSRRTTVYGEKIAEKFGRELADAGFTIVSGMARGVDSYAHKGCLNAKGKTIAVLGSGLDVIYPKENAKLADEIKSTGLLLTEYPLGTPPLAINFPARNRIIAGLSLGILVIEAAIKSGALITADFAMELGKEVFAVPGPITSPNSEGTNSLIKQGAKLVSQVGDILEEYGFSNKLMPDQTGSFLKKLSPDESLIYELLGYNALRVEEIAKQTGWSLSKIQTILTLLELQGLVEQRPGKQFIRKSY